MKGIRTISGLLAGMLLIQTAYSAPGKFFRLTPDGLNINITTKVPTHPTPYYTAGLILNSPGFSVSSGPGVRCTSDGQFCRFAQIGNNLPVSVKITGPAGQTAGLILCLSVDHGLSCQNYSVEIGGLGLIYVVNNDNDTVSKCAIDQSGNLSNCSTAANGFFEPKAIAFNTQKNLAYIAETAGVKKCTISAFGNLTACTPTGPGFGSPVLSIVLDSAQTIAYVTDFAGNITTCTIAISGDLAGCTSQSSGSSILTDITLNPAGNLAYLVGSGVFFSDIVKCGIDSNGNITGCNVTNYNEVFRNITINQAGTYAYLSEDSGSVWQFSINQAGDLVNGIEFTGFNNPRDLIINSAGTELYVSNRSTNTVSRCMLNPANGNLILPYVNSGNGLSEPQGLAFLNINT